MLWSLIKIVLFVVVVAVATVAAGLLIDSGSAVQISYGGWEFTLGPLQALIVGLLALVVVWLLIKLARLLFAVLRFLNGDETAISRYFDRNRAARGYQALSDGMLALAQGEGRLALIKAQRAATYLDHPDLTNLLIAQAAEVAGDTKKADAAYKALLAEPRTRFVGIRGLLKQKLAEGDTETALKLAEKAFEMKPRHADTQSILLKLQSQSADWKGARATLGAQMKSGVLPKEVYKRRDAVMALQEAKGVFAEDASIEAREAAIAANKLSPDLIPAASMAARTYLQKNDKKNAMRVLKKAWEAMPHPDLAAAFAEIEPEESPLDRVKRFRTLTTVHPENSETQQLLAELLITAEDFPAARRAIGDLPVKHPTQRSLAIMAAIERGEGSDDATVRAWLAKALTSPRGPQWCCDKCQAIHTAWAPICENCGGFDTLSWREPVEVTGQSATGAELLSLYVAPPKPQEPDPAPAPLPSRESLARDVN
ncbi:MAG: heme biosynthesis protein HemY [Pseudorhodobacter sp.]|nr:heme biosynthesis protein HemY [Pseudorhodobacter sp.]